MSDQRIPEGIIPPVLTPLKPDQTVDIEAFKQLLTRVVDGGSSAVFVAGTAGLGSVLTTADYELVIATALDHVPSKIPVICGVLEPSTARAVERIRILESLQVQHFVAVTPYYIRALTEETLLRHFSYLRDQTDMNMILYNIPICTQVEIPVSVVVECAKRGWTYACKDSSGNDRYFKELCEKGQEYGLKMYQGMRPDYSKLYEYGAAGSVPVPSNVFPKLFSDAWNARADASMSQELQAEIDKVWAEYVVGNDYISRSIDKLALEGIGNGTKMMPF